MAQVVKQQLATLASHMGTGCTPIRSSSRLTCLALTAEDDPSTWATPMQLRDRDEVQGSWLWSNPVATLRAVSGSESPDGT